MKRLNLLLLLVVATQIVSAQSLSNDNGKSTITQESADANYLKESFINGKALIAVDYSKDGTYVVSGGADKTVEVRMLATGKVLYQLEGHEDDILALSCSPNGRLVASGSVDKKIILWDIITGTKVSVLDGHSDYVRDVEFSPNGRYLVSGSWDQTAIIWDVVTGIRLQTFSGHQDNVTSVSFNSDGTEVVTACGDHNLRVWDVETGELKKVLIGHTDEIWDVKWSHAANLLASGAWDNKARVWNPRTGVNILTFPGHVTDVWSVAFDPEGLTLASAGGDRKIKLWDLPTGRLITDVCTDTHTSDVEEIKFSPDGKNLVSVSRDGSMRIWEVPTLGDRIRFVVEDSLSEWSQRKEFEKMDDFKKRIKRKDKVREEINNYIVSNYTKYYEDNIEWDRDMTIGKYIADDEYFKIESKILGPLKMKVSDDDAQKVSDNLDRLEFKDLSLGYRNGRLVLRSMTVFLKGLNEKFEVTF